MKNPFRPNKFELDSRPLIWVAPIAKRIMDEDGSFYIAGARGSGKTSILKAIDSLELTRNESLKAQIRPFRYGSIAVYMRAQDLFAQSYMGIEWSAIFPSSDPILVEYSFLSSVIECEAAGKLLLVASEWRREGHLHYKLSEAFEVAQQLIPALPGPVRPASLEIGDPLAILATALSRYRKLLAQAALRGDALALSALITDEPLDLIHRAVDLLAPIFEAGQRASKFGPKPFKLKIAVDESDYFSRSQQIALNTLVRRTRAPIHFVIAYVDTGFDSSTTLFENLSLNEADRQVIVLDYETEHEFSELCQAITSYRLYYSIPSDKRPGNVDPKAAFLLDRRLGDFTINDLIVETIGSRPKDAIKTLIDRANELQARFNDGNIKALIPDKAYKDLQFGGARPPIYQAFLIDRLGFDVEDHLLSEDKRDTFLATLRRKQRAALLQIVSDSGKHKMPYYGRRVILQLADSCVRDFLDIMSEIFDASTHDGREGASVQFMLSQKHVDLKIQRASTERAAEKKFAGIERKPSWEPGGRVEVPDTEGHLLARLVDGLGRLTNLLQVSKEGSSNLSTAERGIFVVDMSVIRQIEGLSSRTANVKALESVFRRGIRDNHLVSDLGRLAKPRSTIAVDPSIIRFRLHRRFAPKFSFSYIGALEDVTLPSDLVLELIAANPDFNAENWARRVMSRIAPQGETREQQEDLFLRSITYE